MDFFIGMTDRETEGVYKWVSGEPVTFTNWAPNEPNNCNPNPGPGCAEEDFSHMVWWSGPGHWNDLPSDLGLHAVAEVVPEPSSLLLFCLGLAGVVARVRGSQVGAVPRPESGRASRVVTRRVALRIPPIELRGHTT